jgi:FixJ family two-component response regulator
MSEQIDLLLANLAGTMSIHFDTTPAVIYIVDRDAGSHVAYQAIAERLGVEVRFSTSVDELLTTAPNVAPSCLVYDVRSGRDEFEQWRQKLLQKTSDVPIILIADEHENAQTAFGFQLGALAVLQRPVAMNVLEEYLKYAVRRHRAVRNLVQQHARVQQTLQELTERQGQVLELASTGMPNKTIAIRLAVSQRTVETERAKILRAFSAEAFCDVTAQVGGFRVLETLQDLQQRESVLQQGVGQMLEEKKRHETPARIDLGSLSSDVLMLVSDQTDVSA